MQVNELFFIGCNKYGQAGLGDSNKQQRNVIVPKRLTFSIFIKQLSCGSHHSALLTIDGRIYTMGSNINGTLGCNKTNLNYSFEPILVDSLQNVGKIGCGSYHMCALVENQLYSWGKGIDGQLGHGHTKTLHKPSKIISLGHQVQNFSCGTNHTIVLHRSNNLLYSFGSGIFGQLGTGTNKNCLEPTIVKINTKFDDFSAGQTHSLFLKNGVVYACGDNTSGQIGVGLSKKYVLVPQRVTINESISTIQAAKFSSALSMEGSIYIWGGKGKIENPYKIQSPYENICFSHIQANNNKLVVITTNSQVYEWQVGKISQLRYKKIYVSCNGLLDLAVGQSHMLILGDIVKQIEKVTEIPLQLHAEQEEGDKNEEKSNQNSQLRKSNIILKKKQKFKYKFEKSHDCQRKNSCNKNTSSNNNNSMKNNDPSNNYNDSNENQNNDNNSLNTYNQEQNEQQQQNFVQKSGKKQRTSMMQIMNNINQNLKSINRRRQQTKLGPKNQDNAEIFTNQFVSLEEEDKRQKQKILFQENKSLIRSINSQYIGKNPCNSTLQQQQQSSKISKNDSRKQLNQIYKTHNNQFNTFMQNKSIGKENQLQNINPYVQGKLSSSSISNKQNQDQRQFKRNKHHKESQITLSRITQNNKQLRKELRQRDLKISHMQEILSRKEMKIEEQSQLIKILKQQKQFTELNQ